MSNKMKKTITIFVPIYFCLALASFAQSAKWSAWTIANCHKGLSASAMALGYVKSIDQYSWNWRIKNNYSRTIHINVSLTIGGETRQMGRFTINPGQTREHVSTYFTSSSDAFYVEVTNACFLETWISCKEGCYADCDNGMPNQPDCKNSTKSTIDNSVQNSNSKYQSQQATTQSPSSNQNTYQNTQQQNLANQQELARQQEELKRQEDAKHTEALVDLGVNIATSSIGVVNNIITIKKRDKKLKIQSRVGQIECNYYMYEIDEFTNDLTIMTKPKILSGTGLGFSTSFNFKKINSSRIFQFAIVSKSECSMYVGKELLIKMDNGEMVTLIIPKTIKANKVASGTMGAITDFELSNETFEKLISSKIVKMRINYANTVVDVDVKKDRALDFQKSMYCIE